MEAGPAAGGKAGLHPTIVWSNVRGSAYHAVIGPFPRRAPETRQLRNKHPLTMPHKIPNNRIPAPGWIGGFSASNPNFAYPDPDLSSLPLLGNMDNIPRLRRQVMVLWPEFSWETVIGDPDSRCYQMFAPDISRLGYDDAGRAWSIICPQQGAVSKILGSLNIEVTVTGQRGWVDESVTDRDSDLLAADMNVTGKIWFGPGSGDKLAYHLLKSLFKAKNLPFPLDKANAIQVTLHQVNDPSVPTISVRSGIDGSFRNPDFALHHADAWGVANVAVQIGPILPTYHPLVDEFNALVMDVFNLASGNLLSPGNILTWNVWFDAPTHVDRHEWQEHAEKWRRSIDADHGSPDGKGSSPRYFDGTCFSPLESAVDQEWCKIKAWLEKHFGISLPESPTPEWLGPV